MENYLKCKHVQIWVLLHYASIQAYLATVKYDKTQTDIS